MVLGRVDPSHVMAVGLVLSVTLIQMMLKEEELLNEKNELKYVVKRKTY